MGRPKGSKNKKTLLSGAPTKMRVIQDSSVDSQLETEYLAKLANPSNEDVAYQQTKTISSTAKRAKESETAKKCRFKLQSQLISKDDWFEDPNLQKLPSFYQGDFFTNQNDASDRLGCFVSQISKESIIDKNGLQVVESSPKSKNNTEENSEEQLQAYQVSIDAFMLQLTPQSVLFGDKREKQKFMANRAVSTIFVPQILQILPKNFRKKRIHKVSNKQDNFVYPQIKPPPSKKSKAKRLQSSGSKKESKNMNSISRPQRARIPKIRDQNEVFF